MRTKTPTAILALLVVNLLACSTGVDRDASVDRDACPGTRPIPTSLVYECDAAVPTDAVGCPGRFETGGRVWGDDRTYPVGCRAYLPVQKPACVGACCVPQGCFCSERGAEASPAFVCPI